MSLLEKVILFFFKNPFQLILLISIIGLAFLIKTSHAIRSIGYDQVPENYTVLDERTNVWHGLSIRDTGVPAAWSDLRSYWEKWPKEVTNLKTNSGGLTLRNFNIAINGEKPKLFPVRNFPQLTIYTTQYDFGTGKQYLSIVQPYLDHPPFGALILSSMVSNRVTDTRSLTPQDFRRTSLYLADLTTILIFILAIQITKNPLIGFISAAVYETVPTYILTSRLALLENVLIPMQLISLNLLLFAVKRKTQNKYFISLLILSGIFSGLAFLSKTTGIAVLISGVIILLCQKIQIKKIVFFALPSLLISSIYFIWGILLSPQIFPKIVLEQSTQRIFVGALGIFQQFFKYGMMSFPIDGWWTGGFLTMLFWKLNKNTLPVIVSIITLLFIIPLTGASSFAWYFIPFIPFAALSTGYFLWDWATKPKFFHSLIAFFVFFSSSYFWAYGVYGANPNFTNHQQQFFLYKIFICLFFTLALAAYFLHQKSKIFTIMWFGGVMILILFLFRMNFKSFFYIISHWTHLINNYSPNWVL